MHWHSTPTADGLGHLGNTGSPINARHGRGHLTLHLPEG